MLTYMILLTAKYTITLANNPDLSFLNIIKHPNINIYPNKDNVEHTITIIPAILLIITIITIITII